MLPLVRTNGVRGAISLRTAGGDRGALRTSPNGLFSNDYGTNRVVCNKLHHCAGDLRRPCDLRVLHEYGRTNVAWREAFAGLNPELGERRVIAYRARIH